MSEGIASCERNALSILTDNGCEYQFCFKDSAFGKMLDSTGAVHFGA